MEGQKIYQMATLSPDLIDRMVVDDSPPILYNEFWDFLGVDIPVANIDKFDFNILRLMIRRQILNILERYPETEWDMLAIVEEEQVEKTDANGNIYYTKDDAGNDIPVMVKKTKAKYLILELLDMLDTKVYVKLCRGREGFTLNALTEERQKIRQDINENRPVVVSQGVPSGQAQESGGWSL